MAPILTSTTPRPADRAALRHRIERAIEEALDTAARLVGFLDDPDAEVATAWGTK